MPEITDLEKELEDFEAELHKDEGELEPSSDPSVEKPDDDPVVEEDQTPKDDDDSQKADPGTEDHDPKEDAEEDPTPKPAPKLTTLPDDPETFGKLAGKEVTAEQLIEEGFLEKLVTWGHQGRHMVQKGQKDIAKAAETESEIAKLREILEKQVKLEEEARNKPVDVSEEDFANKLVETYVPGLKKVAEQGGVEVDFIKEFPKAASHFEHRLQSGASVLTDIVAKVDEIWQMVQPIQEDRSTSTARKQYDTMAESLVDGQELFEPLKEKAVRDDLLNWLAAEDTGLRVVDKDVSKITSAELQSAYLLYVHSHPDVLKKETVEKKTTDSHLAGGGGGRGSTTSKSGKVRDDLSDFESEYRTSERERYED